MARQGFWWFFNYRAVPPVHPSIGGAPILDAQSPPGSTMVRMVGRITVDLQIAGQTTPTIWTVFAGVTLNPVREDPTRGDPASFTPVTWPWWDMIPASANHPIESTTNQIDYLGSTSVEFDVEGGRTFDDPLHLQFCVATPFGQPPSPGGMFVRFSVRTFVLWP